jgi:hypothetical protein
MLKALSLPFFKKPAVAPGEPPAEGGGESPAPVKKPALPWRLRALLWIRRGARWREVLSLAIIMSITLLLWNTWAVYPLKLLVVFFHEFSQGLMGLATGGRITEISITPDMHGNCTVEGGHALSILLAGYWGSLAWGIVLYGVALKWARANWVNAMLGVMIYTVAVRYVPPFSMGFAMAALAGAGMFFAAIKLPIFVNRVLLKVIALTNCLYALFDVRGADSAGSNLQTDAEKLAELTGVPAVLWGLLWIGVALPAVCFLLLAVTRRRVPAKKAA